MAPFQLSVNGTRRVIDVEPGMPLLWVLRDVLGLTGTKYGCGRGLCGACTVHVDGRSRPACLTPVSSIGDAEIVTIEGLSAEGDHPVQRAWTELRVAQCGYCQTGQIMQAAALLAHDQDPSSDEIRQAMNRNLCRCGTYVRIVGAIRRAADLIREEG